MDRLRHLVRAISVASPFRVRSTALSAAPIHTFFEGLFKWWLDLVKNVFATAALYAFAKKTGSPVLENLAHVTLVATVGYHSVIFQKWEIVLKEDWPGAPWLARIIGLIITLYLTFVLAVYFNRGIQAVIDLIPPPA